MEQKQDKIIFEDENGTKTELTILLTYHSDTFNKDYVVFYENNDDLVAGEVDQDGNIHDIQSDEEYDELDEIIDEYLSSKDKETK